jgi:hypothetical protein
MHFLQVEFYNAVKGRLGEKNVEMIRFDDMVQGFAGGRSDLKNEIVKQRVEQVIGLLVSFFSRQLK